MMWGGYDGWGWGWGLGMIHGLLWWVLVILGIIVLVRLLGRSSASAPTSPGAAAETALEILKRRYASGEIGKAEFEEKKRDLT
ncbi:MAG TPA: SHOCT domain-containing protein [Burkholderiaceae bacterium]|nr:SHOCT domain-containing protein [Burkholderiaceae bacterium]